MWGWDMGTWRRRDTGTRRWDTGLQGHCDTAGTAMGPRPPPPRPTHGGAEASPRSPRSRPQEPPPQRPQRQRRHLVRGETTGGRKLPQGGRKSPQGGKKFLSEGPEAASERAEVPSSRPEAASDADRRYGGGRGGGGLLPAAVLLRAGAAVPARRLRHFRAGCVGVPGLWSGRVGPSPRPLPGPARPMVLLPRPTPGPVPSAGPSSSLSGVPVSPALEERCPLCQVTPRCWPGCTAPRR